jgi:Na+/melibiose symporter-like transporter
MVGHNGSSVGTDAVAPNSGADSKVTLRTKFMFGIGAAGESATNWIFNILVFFFYQQILGLSGSLAGIAVALAIISDAVTDPLVGSISDRFVSKHGRRHPFMFVAPVPLALCIFLIFHPPSLVLESQSLMFCWFIVFTVLMRTFQTFFAVPHLAMGAELSEDYYERTTIMSFNALFALYGGVFMHSVSMILIFGFFFEAEGGRLYQPAYTWVALICCALVVVTILACAWGTRDQIDLLRSKENPTQRLSLAVFARDVGAVLKNRNYRFLLVGLFFLSLTIGTHETLGIYMATFFWELTSYQYGFLVLNNIIGVHLGFFLSARLHGEFDKRWTIVVSSVGLSVFWSMGVNLALMGLAPENTSWSLVLFIVFLGSFASFFGAVLNISVMSALADVADEHELETGMRQEGIFYSARAFFAKAMNATGHVIAGFAIDFYILLPPRSVPGEVADDVIFRLGVVDGPFAMIWGVIAGAIYLGYRIDKRRFNSIRKGLAEARVARAAVVE